MADHLFENPNLAALYDTLCEGRPDFPFYLPLMMESQSVLDVGCGTGALLHSAREAGHTGRLCGIDPAFGMLEQARKRSDIEWVQGDMTSVDLEHEFDLIIMTGHAFQVLLKDEELRAFFAAIRSTLTDTGRFIFETRNPLVQGWKAWAPGNAIEIVDSTGAVIKSAHEVIKIDGDLVTFTNTFTSPSWDVPEISQSTLRFLDIDSLSQFLTHADLTIETQYGYWDKQPLTDSSEEIITIARRSK